ncbi:MAG: META domain-containing protein [Patescibacteria group bacterium]
MKKYLLYIVGAVVILIGAFYVFASHAEKGIQKETPGQDYKKISVVINGETHILGSGGTQYFGNEAREDLDADGDEDVVFLITYDGRGSGTFYYLVGALKNDTGYVGTQVALIGDRIAPQTTEKGPNKSVIVNYADRAPGEPFTTSPSHGKSIRFLLDTQTMSFGEVAQNFEGEADPSRMNLEMKKWVWISALYNDGREVKPKTAGIFTLSFNKGKFSATTDCNGVGGNYNANGTNLIFTNMISTLMFCEGSQESEFTQLLTNTSGYHFTSKGELILDLKFDSGSVVFK